MKKLVLLALLITSFSVSYAAVDTVIKINVVNFQFKPKTVNAKVGDTIKWVWKTGSRSHTTTSTSIPKRAKKWDDTLDASHKTSFRYVLKVAGTYQYQCTFHASIGMVGTLNVTSALSADLNGFNVDDANATAQLGWKTTSSKDIAYFSVQRSTDGDNFTEIGRVQPGMSNQYKYTDRNTTSSKYVYYQVEMIDTKGNRELSPIQMYTQKQVTQKLITSISPNPVSNPGHLMFQFNADKDGTLLVQLYNQSGAFITQTQMSASVGLNNGHFHLGSLTPGTYYIVCTLGATQEKHTIIVK